MRKLALLTMLLALLAAPLGVMAQDDEDAEAMMDASMADSTECAMPESLPETVTIGAIFGLSGPISVYGGPQQNAVELAVSEMNESGYFGEGTTLEVIFEDSGGEAEGAINAMTKLVEEDEVTAVIGPTLSTEAFAADPHRPGKQRAGHGCE